MEPRPISSGFLFFCNFKFTANTTKKTMQSTPSHLLRAHLRCNLRLQAHQLLSVPPYEGRDRTRVRGTWGSEFRARLGENMAHKAFGHFREGVWTSGFLVRTGAEGAPLRLEPMKDVNKTAPKGLRSTETVWVLLTTAGPRMYLQKDVVWLPRSL